jgi:hypothetical protein
VATTAAGDHSDELAEFGYKQELDRSIGRFASFAAGVSYISILTGTYLQDGAVLFIGVVFLGGLAYYWFVQRHKTGVLASHAFASPSPAVPATSVRPAPAAGGSE